MNEMENYKSNQTKDAETLEREINQTRAEMNQTLDALEHKLTAGQLLDQCLKFFGKTGGEIGSSIGNSVKENPVPFLLTATGVAWMMFGPDRSKRHSGYYETGYSEERYAGTYTDDLYEDGSGTASGIGNKVRAGATAAGNQLSRSKEALREGVSKTSKTVKDTVSSTSSAVKDSLNRTTVAAQNKAVQAKEQFNVMLEEQPLLLGFLGVAVGAAIGFMLPHTQQEDQLVGEVRDKAIAKAKDFGAQSYEQARNIAEQKIAGTVQANAGNSEPGHSHGHV
jgi:ElaB/YqjD/DUF883 family membrane-anchored ribosome-binding protein